ATTTTINVDGGVVIFLTAGGGSINLDPTFTVFSFGLPLPAPPTPPRPSLAPAQPPNPASASTGPNIHDRSILGLAGPAIEHDSLSLSIDNGLANTTISVLDA